MSWSLRDLFPYIAAVACVAALSYAISFGTIPRADFTFINGTEIQSIDPSVVTGVPEGRIIASVFEGLYRLAPNPDDPSVLEPQPAMAEKHEISQDRRTYTFHLRPSANWSDGSTVTADDFVWSWRRFLHPEIAARYHYQLTDYVVGAAKFNSGDVQEGDRVEVELRDRLNPDQPFPSGTILPGVLEEIITGPAPEFDDDDDTRKKADARWRDGWVFRVQIKSEKDGVVAWDEPGTTYTFCRSDRPNSTSQSDKVRSCHLVLPHFAETVGIRAIDDRRFQVQLKNPTPYFLDLAAFYPLFPVNRRCVEKYGYPNWTRPENIVHNGPYKIEFRRIRDRIRLKKNPLYWNADSVRLNRVDAMAVQSSTTQLNMYMNGLVDWATDVPQSMIPDLVKREDFVSAPMLSTYFYRFNVDRPPLDNSKVRQALNLALNKRELCEQVLRAGQQPARSLCPPGMALYRPPQCELYDVEKARQLLSEAGFPGGKGFPRLEILYNSSDNHRIIAEVIQQQWQQNLSIADIDITNREWNSYLEDVQQQQYVVARAGWVGDYNDPNTFLDMFVSDGPNNNTGWSNAKYDQLIDQAKSAANPNQRMAILRDAEAILLEDMPIVPIYFYVSINMVRPHVKGFHANIQDLHPLQFLQVDKVLH